jgi:hypothetical protein
MLHARAERLAKKGSRRKKEASLVPTMAALAIVLVSATAMQHTRRLGTVRACAFSDNESLEMLRRRQADFVEARDWAQFHTPRSLALALVGEVGEVCELLQCAFRASNGTESAP